MFKNFSERFEINIKQVIIHKLVDGVFYSSLISERQGVEETIDARTSDAIALALRFDAPIFTYQNILDKAGIYLNAEPKSAKEQREEADTILDSVMPDEPLSSSSSSDYSNLSLKELNKMLDQAVSKEDYEQAALLRDEISKRN